MSRLAWIIAFSPLLLLALKLSVLDEDAQTLSCAEAKFALEGDDFAQPLPETAALLIGNRRVKHWEKPPEAIGGRDTLTRSVAGLTPENLDRCFPRLIGHYQPELVVMPIDTEYGLAVETQALLDTLQGLIDQRDVYSLQFELWIIGPITSPRFSGASEDHDHLQALNASGADWVKQKTDVRWLSVQKVLSDDQGATKAEFFWPNGNTLNEAGYQQLTRALLAISNGRNKNFTGIVSK